VVGGRGVLPAVVCRRDELKTERLRVEALKWELARVTLKERLEKDPMAAPSEGETL
jgi:hypothetical protein